MKHIHKILEDSETMHRKMAEELEEEKEKNASMKGIRPTIYVFLQWRISITK